MANSPLLPVLHLTASTGSTAFGPQSPNYVTVEPTIDPNVSGQVDTWGQDCTTAGATNGTYYTASWFNMVTGNLRTLCRESGQVLTEGDNSLVYNAVVLICTQLIANLTTNYVVPVPASPSEIETGVGVGYLTPPNLELAAAAGLQWPVVWAYAGTLASLTATNTGPGLAGSFTSSLQTTVQIRGNGPAPWYTLDVQNMTGAAAAIYGKSFGGNAIKGEVTNPANTVYGVVGVNTGGGLGTGGTAIVGQGGYFTSTNNVGLQAVSNAGGFAAVLANANGSSAVAVNGIAATGYGGLFQSGGDDGVFSYTTSTTIGVYGIYGLGNVSAGVYGTSASGAGGKFVSNGAGQSGCIGFHNTNGLGVNAYSAGGYALYADSAGSDSGHFVGTVFAGGGFTSSDIKLKRNIKDIPNDVAVHFAKELRLVDFFKLKDTAQQTAVRDVHNADEASHTKRLCATIVSLRNPIATKLKSTTYNTVFDNILTYTTADAVQAAFAPILLALDNAVDAHEASVATDDSKAATKEAAAAIDATVATVTTDKNGFSQGATADTEGLLDDPKQPLTLRMQSLRKRLKTEVRKLKVQLNSLLPPLSTTDRDNLIGRQAGVIAQELQAVIKETGYGDWLITSNPVSGVLAVDMMSVNSIINKGNQVRMSQLEAQMAALIAGQAPAGATSTVPSNPTTLNPDATFV